MNVDERIEALTARHEALTQSVELLASFHRDTETAMRETNAAMHDLDAKLTAKIAENAGNMAQISQLVLFHEQRLNDLKR